MCRMMKTHNILPTLRLGEMARLNKYTGNKKYENGIRR